MVRFNDNNGNIENVWVWVGDKLTQPEDPERAGYAFTGWYLDGEEWDFSTDRVKKSITLYAGWETDIRVPSDVIAGVPKTDGPIMAVGLALLCAGICLLAAMRKRNKV